MIKLLEYDEIYVKSKERLIKDLQNWERSFNGNTPESQDNGSTGLPTDAPTGAESGYSS
jgi:hypothetical protein